LPGEIPKNIQIKKVLPTIMSRTMAESWLSANVKTQDTLLCLGNLPPLFKSKGRVVVFLQNRYLIDNVNLNGFPLQTRLRINIERLWLNLKMKSANEFIVQTQTMKKLLEIKSEGTIPIRILPFAMNPSAYMSNRLRRNERLNQFDFIYVASGEEHKNHKNLLQAWSLLAAEGLFPSLCLTLSHLKFNFLSREIEIMRLRYGLAVTNVGELSHQDILVFYESAGALIYPSKLESFGLPLIEASQLGLPILASELDFVRDIVNPEESFDPNSAISIARAVKRFMKIDHTGEAVLLDAGEFIDEILRFH